MLLSMTSLQTTIYPSLDYRFICRNVEYVLYLTVPLILLSESCEMLPQFDLVNGRRGSIRQETTLVSIVYYRGAPYDRKQHW